MESTIDLDYGRYPIVLSDALLGKATNELYTGITYNHKAGSSSPSASNPYRLRPSEEDSDNYNLSYSENTENFTYEGERISEHGQYVLIFDPMKEHFVLHRIDSTFDMKLVSAPWLQNTPIQRSQHGLPETKALPPQRKTSKGSGNLSNKKNDGPRRKAENGRKTVVQREPSPEEEDSDGGLTVEYPDGHNIQQNPYKSALAYQRQTSEEEASDEDEDAVHEYEDAELTQENLQTPSHTPSAVADLSDEDMGMTLEAELEQELLKESPVDPPDESDESEEE